MINKVFNDSMDGKTDELQELAINNPELFNEQLNKKDSLGYSPLAIAVTRGNIEIVEFLIKHGANANSQDEKNNTPLHYVGVYNFFDLGKLLLDNGADIHIKDRHDNQPLWTAVFNAADGGTDKLPLVKLLLDHGANPNNKNKSDKSPLDFAKTVGDKPLINLLKRYVK